MASSRDRARSYSRISRVNVLLRRVLAEEIERLADADDRLAMLTVTEVLCEQDLHRAVVYFASLSPEAADGLVERRKALQAAIGTQMRMRRVPLLSFAADPAVEAGERIEQAIRRAKRALAPETQSVGEAETGDT